MKPEQIERINQLAQKMRTPEGLTPEEQREQADLRAAYIAAFRSNLKAQLDNTVVVQPDGTKTRLTQKETAVEKTVH